MPPPPKKSATNRATTFLSRTAGKGAGAAALGVAANAAVNLLSDPKVREQLIEFGTSLGDSVKARAAARKAAKAELPDGHGSSIRDRMLRQRRLETRADKLSESLDLLRMAPGEESASALEQVANVVGRVRLALTVADNLPLRRRIAAQNEIAGTLRKLESAVVDATMPTTMPTDATSL